MAECKRYFYLRKSSLVLLAILIFDQIDRAYRRPVRKRNSICSFVNEFCGIAGDPWIRFDWLQFICLAVKCISYVEMNVLEERKIVTIEFSGSASGSRNVKIQVTLYLAARLTRVSSYYFIAQ